MLDSKNSEMLKNAENYETLWVKNYRVLTLRNFYLNFIDKKVLAKPIFIWMNVIDSVWC